MRRQNCVWPAASEFTPFLSVSCGKAHCSALWSPGWTVFVELAHRERLSLATFDSKLLKTYPDIAKRPKDLT